MDNNLFISAIHNLLHISVLSDAQDEENIRNFAERFCFNAQFQPLFQAENLCRLIGEMEESILYEFRDTIGICLLLLRIEKNTFLIGPFVRREFDAVRLRRVTISMGITVSAEESLRLYYSNFPLCSMSRAIDTVLACVKTFWPESESLRLARIDDYPESRRLPKEAYTDNTDYSSIYLRYDLENHFLRCIERGDVENVLTAYTQMNTSGLSGKRHSNAIYQDATIGFAILRTLARKAAENGGASLPDVHEIVQRAIQLSLAEQDITKRIQTMRNMILELTEAVDRARSRMGNYSPPIRKAVDLLRHRFSQELDLRALAAQVGLSPSYLSHCFSKELGMSITQYIAVLRCEAAASMLNTSNTPINEISTFVGYFDSNYFVKVFKKHYGTTPSEFRAGKKNSDG
ncbi:MAG: helix-turn-helix transcriptional regulator [Oscillospiraceae bacterium]|nr:helix-turn-helix transcriptional regulator [Oscillospiraceae bacterium]